MDSRSSQTIVRGGNPAWEPGGRLVELQETVTPATSSASAIACDDGESLTVYFLAPDGKALRYGVGRGPWEDVDENAQQGTIALVMWDDVNERWMVVGGQFATVFPALVTEVGGIDTQEKGDVELYWEPYDPADMTGPKLTASGITVEAINWMSDDLFEAGETVIVRYWPGDNNWVIFPQAYPGPI